MKQSLINLWFCGQLFILTKFECLHSHICVWLGKGKNRWLYGLVSKATGFNPVLVTVLPERCSRIQVFSKDKLQNPRTAMEQYPGIPPASLDCTRGLTLLQQIPEDTVCFIRCSSKCAILHNLSLSGTPNPHPKSQHGRTKFANAYFSHCVNGKQCSS